MYDTLLQLPLFQGLGRNDITDILSKVKFHFKRYEAGECIFQQDSVCSEVGFLLGGTVVAETLSRDHSYLYCETISTACVVELYSLFGILPRYQATYRAVTEANVLTISKQYLFELLGTYVPCALNFSNILCSRSQYLYQRIWSDMSGCLLTRFVYFLMLRSSRPSGHKLLRIKMNDLANLLSDRRINVSRMLNALQADGLVLLRRKEIEIPALEKLVWHLNNR